MILDKDKNDIQDHPAPIRMGAARLGSLRVANHRYPFAAFGVCVRQRPVSGAKASRINFTPIKLSASPEAARTETSTAFMA
jgi:hypothetical protein